MAGDYNVAPEARDVHDPAQWEDKIHFTPPEREALHALFEDRAPGRFRLFEQPERSYTWWDYRMMSFRRKMGLRIDHILLVARAREALHVVHDRRRAAALERPSDHAPVIAEFDV